MKDPIDDRGVQIAALPGAQIAWKSFGQGRPLLLVRGLGTQLIEWPRAYVDAWVSAGYRVIVFDNRDCGASSDHAGEAYSVSDMGDDCVALLDHLRIERALCFGISMGGMIIQRLAVDHSERFDALVSVMSSTGNPELPRPAPEVLEALTAPAPATLEEAVARNAADRLLFGSPHWPLPEAERLVLARRALERAWRPDGVTRQFAAILRDGDRRAALADVNVPMLVIHGLLDPLVPVDGGRDIAASVPNAELELIDGMGHDLPEALAPTITERVLRFFSARAPL
ncbi:MAG: alpha/beta hydrolase [Pseudomonadales bacterium]|nr:alpha/beta hydrolase [Pseudomonadales bacterium]